MDGNQPPADGGWLMSPVVWAAGLAGAMVSLAHVKGVSIGQRLVMLLAGTLTATFLTPAVADYAKMGLNGVAATAFGLGLVGMVLTSIAYNLALRAKEDPGVLIDLARRLTGRPPAPPAAITVTMPTTPPVVTVPAATAQPVAPAPPPPGQPSGGQ